MERVMKVMTLCVLSVALAGCWHEEKPINVVRPVSVVTVERMAEYEKEYVGVVTPQESTVLAFPVAGQVVAVNVVEGSDVRKGEVLARLNPEEMTLQFEAEKANFQTKQSILDRSERLLARNAISLQEVEIARAELQAARSSYEYALSQLSNTRLTAPFDGSIEKRYVEQFQRVGVGEPIVRVINPARLDVTFLLPESDADIVYAQERFTVIFDNRPDIGFAAEIKASVNASVNGAGIPVTLSITDARFSPQRYNVKSGFACRVKVGIEIEERFGDYVTVPLTAIFSPSGTDSETCVWVYDSADARVSMRRVITDGLSSADMVIVKDGLRGGELVVTAGVYHLVEGQKVSLLNGESL